jgi:hypothetical protein
VETLLHAALVLSANTQYLEISDNDVFHFNTSDFTIEAWIYPLNFGNYRSIYHQGETSGNYYMNSVEVMSSGALRWLIRSQSTTVLSITTNASTLTANTWQHIAATREGNYFKLWINGVLSKTSGFISTALDNLTYDVHIGNRVIGGTPTHQYYGYMDEVRVTNGTALYTAAFSPPTERFKNGAWLDVIYPAGTNSARYLEFDGSDDYVDCGSIGSMTAFTVELWINPDAVQDYQNPIDCNYSYNGTTGNIGPRLELRTGASPNWIISGDTGNNNAYYYIVARSGAPSTGTWYHAVLTYDGSGNTSGVKSYWDGSLVTSGLTNVNTPSAVWVNTMNNVELGHGFHLGSSRHFNGKIGSAKIYTQELTAAEVLENYNSTKSRFS